MFANAFGANLHIGQHRACHSIYQHSILIILLK